MSSQRAQRRASTFVCQLHATVPLIREKTLLGEPAHHSANGRRSHHQTLRDVIRRNGVGAAAESVDRLEIILDGTGKNTADRAGRQRVGALLSFHLFTPSAA